MVHAISMRDYPVIQGGVLVIAICFCLVMLLVDIILAFVDPRIQDQFSGKKKKRGGLKMEDRSLTAAEPKRELGISVFWRRLREKQACRRRSHRHHPSAAYRHFCTGHCPV